MCAHVFTLYTTAAACLLVGVGASGICAEGKICNDDILGLLQTKKNVRSLQHVSTKPSQAANIRAKELLKRSYEEKARAKEAYRSEVLAMEEQENIHSDLNYDMNRYKAAKNARFLSLERATKLSKLAAEEERKVLQVDRQKEEANAGYQTALKEAAGAREALRGLKQIVNQVSLLEAGKAARKKAAEAQTLVEELTKEEEMHIHEKARLEAERLKELELQTAKQKEEKEAQEEFAIDTKRSKATQSQQLHALHEKKEASKAEAELIKLAGTTIQEVDYDESLLP